MRERLLADWPFKLLALVLAFAIWASITGQDRTLRDVDVPLEIAAGGERIATGTPPTTVKIRLDGPRTTIRRLDPLRLAVRLDLQDAPLGEREVPLTTSHVTGVPRGVEVLLFDPDRVRLNLARRARRELEIVPVLVGEPAAGHMLYGFTVDPPAAVVQGPQDAVESMGDLHTVPIPLEDHAAPFVADVGLVPEDPRVRVLDVPGVKVRVLVEASPVSRRLEELPVRLPFSAPRSTRLRPPAVDVTLAGPAWLLERIDPAQFSVVAAVERPGPQRTDDVPLRVELRLSEEQERLVTVKSVHPSRVSVHIPDG